MRPPYNIIQLLPFSNIGLSEKYIYSNDDFLIVRDTTPSDFCYCLNGQVFPNDVAVGIIGGPRMLESPWRLTMNRTNHFFNHIYGDMERYSQGHVPQLQDRKIWADLKKKNAFFDALKQTSANRFRGLNDLVTLFTYYNFIIGISK